jgi:hypothetical protein
LTEGIAVLLTKNLYPLENLLKTLELKFTIIFFKKNYKNLDSSRRDDIEACHMCNRAVIAIAAAAPCLGQKW